MLGKMKKKKYIYGEKRNCIICGVEFRPKDKKSKQKCCSNICKGKLQTKNSIRRCIICGIDFLPARRKFKTCSRKCGAVYRLSRLKRNPMANINAKLAKACCVMVHRCLKNKTDRTYNLLGFTAKQLKENLEKHFLKGMSWDNYGKNKGQWSIDHTRPISSFSSDDSIAKINALDNLRPMWHCQNCSKRNKWKGQ